MFFEWVKPPITYIGFFLLFHPDYWEGTKPLRSKSFCVYFFMNIVVKSDFCRLKLWLQKSLEWFGRQNPSFASEKRFPSGKDQCSNLRKQIASRKPGKYTVGSTYCDHFEFIGNVITVTKWWHYQNSLLWNGPV